MRITTKNRERFLKWMRTHEPHEIYVINGEHHPADQVAELLGIKWHAETAPEPDSINTDVEAQDEDLGQSYDSGDSEEY